MASNTLVKEKQDLAIELGKRISGKIICPDCEKQGSILAGQEMFAVGDNESTLFCPHCEMSIKIEVINLPYE